MNEVENNLRILMAQKKISITDLSVATGISRNTIAGIYHEKNKGINYEKINKLCDFFKCTPNDLVLLTETQYSD